MTELSFRTVPRLFGVSEANETREFVVMEKEQDGMPFNAGAALAPRDHG